MSTSIISGMLYNSFSPSLTLIILSPIRKSIERGDFAASEVDVVLVDFLPKKIQLGIEFVLFDVDMP